MWHKHIPKLTSASGAEEPGTGQRLAPATAIWQAELVWGAPEAFLASLHPPPQEDVCR